jgi:hypothetical protein
VAFVAVMVVALVLTLAFILDGVSTLAMVGQLALALVCLQVGYFVGVLVRAYADVARPRFSKRASTPGSLPRKAR